MAKSDALNLLFIPQEAKSTIAVFYQSLGRGSRLVVIDSWLWLAWVQRRIGQSIHDFVIHEFVPKITWLKFTWIHKQFASLGHESLQFIDLRKRRKRTKDVDYNVSLSHGDIILAHHETLSVSKWRLDYYRPLVWILMVRRIRGEVRKAPWFLRSRRDLRYGQSMNNEVASQENM